jgi:hypothetical protein
MNAVPMIARCMARQERKLTVADWKEIVALAGFTPRSSSFKRA